MARERWTLERLEQACRDALIHRSSVKSGPLPPSLAADVWWSSSGGKARVRVDGHKVGLRPGVIHELLHVVLDESLSGFDESLKEVVILAFESHLDSRIANSRRRVQWWQKAINGKLR